MENCQKNLANRVNEMAEEKLNKKVLSTIVEDDVVNAMNEQQMGVTSKIGYSLKVS